MEMKGMSDMDEQVRRQAGPSGRTVRNDRAGNDVNTSDGAGRQAAGNASGRSPVKNGIAPAGTQRTGRAQETRSDRTGTGTRHTERLTASAAGTTGRNAADGHPPVDPERARRKAEARRLKREKERQRRLMLGASVIAAVLVLTVVFLVIGSRRSSRLDNAAAQTAVQAAGDNRDLSQNTQSDPVVNQEASAAVFSEASSAAETAPAVTAAPAELVSEGYIDDDGTVHFVNDPAYSEKITILGTGDNLIHEALFLDAETEDGYDFTPLYARIKPYIEWADIASVNQETPIATAIASASGYPHFNTPTEDGDAMIDAGFDIFNLATNHVYDMGVEGLYATIEYFNDAGVPYFGAYYDADDRYTVRTKTANGITVAFVGFINYTNQDVDEMDSQLYWIDDYESVRERIRKAKEEADIVVAYAHWGEEYENVLTDQMTEAAQVMVDAGADIIFGDHTHILQKITVLQRESDGKLCPIQYCGGNLVSGQKTRQSLLSTLTTVEMAKNPETGDIVVTGFKALPIVTHYIGDRTDVEVYPLDQYTEELANANGVKQFEEETMTLDYMWDLVNAEIPEQFLAHTSDYDDGELFN